MKEIQITIPKVHCQKKNDFLNKDRVYIVVLITTVKVGAVPKIVFSAISTVSKKLRKKEMTSLNLTKPWTFEVDDDEIFNISFGLYEYDNGDIYDTYQEKIGEINATDGMNYAAILNEIWNGVKDDILNLNLVKLLTILPGIGLNLIKNLRKDDLLGKRSLSFKSNDPNIEFIPEFDLTDSESHYKLQIQMKIIN